jgi:O-antigen ligase
MNQVDALPRRGGAFGAVYALGVLVPVLHLAHATGLRNTIAAVTTILAIAQLVRCREWPPLAWPVIAWLLIGITSSLWSLDAETTLKSVLTDTVMPFGAFYAAYLGSRRPEGFRGLVAVVLLGIAIVAGFTLIAFAADLADQLPAERRGGALYYYPGPGVASTLALYAVPFALLSAGDSARMARYIGYAGLICILLVGVGTTNRTFWLVLAVALAIFYLWQAPRYTVRQRYLIGAAILGLAVLAGAMVHHLNAFRDPRDSAVEIRLHGWREWSAIADGALVHGYGVGRKIIREVLAEGLSEQLVILEPNFKSHAHNLFLNTVLQTGLLGLLALCVLVGSLFREAWNARDSTRLHTSAALATLAVVMLAKNFTDDFMEQAGVIAFWAYAGALVGRLRADGGG